MIPDAWVAELKLESSVGRYLERGFDGVLHFNGNFSTAAALKDALAADDLIDAQTSDNLLGLYERVFSHHSFTGRSGVMYKYEGLRCIYWHMVSKLLIETGDAAVRADAAGQPRTTVRKLVEIFHDVLAGIGVHKSAAQHGAFPIDAYSHTPGFTGAQQPGLTGQVKEDVLARFRQLGVHVSEGALHFDPLLLDSEEFLKQAARWRYSTGNGDHSESLQPQTLAFTICGVLVVYRLAAAAKIRVLRADGTLSETDGVRLSAEESASIFRREGQILRLDVDVATDRLR